MAATFDDGKDEGALRTIGELGAALNIKPHVLRYWEEQFPMLRPLKRSGNRRYYRSGDVAMIQRIDRLVNGQGYTIKGARQAIESDTLETADIPRENEPLAPAGIADDILVELKDIRTSLANALNS